MFAVIIPYYQREPGLLARAIRSVCDQTIGDPICIHVVDDASPVPAKSEVDAVERPANVSVSVRKQPNGGPGAARNAGLDGVTHEDYIAFLDSDDTWQPFHLQAARYAFDSGFDLYTADRAIDGQGGSELDYYYGGTLTLERFGEPEWAHELLAPLMNYTVCGPIGRLTSMVIHTQLARNVRFRTELRTAGEDGLFACCLAAMRPRVMISRRYDSVSGRGVNIFSAGGWGSRQDSMRSIYFLRSRLLMAPLVSGFPTAAANLRHATDHARRALWRCMLASARRGHLPLRELANLVLLDPLLLLSAPAALVSALKVRKGET